MKTSNKIIIAFAVFIVGGMLTLFITAKQHTKETISKTTKTLHRSYQLKPFSVVVAEDSAEVGVEHSDNFSVDIVLKNREEKTTSKFFKLSGDTLYVYKGRFVNVKCKDLRAVVGNHHYKMVIYNFAPDSISFNLKGGETYFDNRDVRNEVLNIGIIAKDSALIRIQNSTVNVMNITSDNAKTELNCNAKKVTANLQNKSTLVFSKNPKSMEYLRDSTSTMAVSYNPD